MQTTDVTVHYITPGGMAFGHTSDNTQVFIPKRLVASVPGFAYSTYRADVIPNPFKPEKTPLMAVSFQIDGQDDEPVIEEIAPEPVAEVKADAPTSTDELKAIGNAAVALVKSGGAWTVAELVDRLCHDEARRTKAASYIAAYLTDQFVRGHIARAEVYSKPDMKRPSLCRYAADWRLL